MVSLLYILLAILALSFLIFIHELGHYFMARRVGMRVDTFSIGFGSPIVSWKWQDTKWQIGWILFGGFVQIAGTDAEKESDLYAIKNGYFSKSPWDRIKVSFMGPFVNIVFAFFVFVLLWTLGGREKDFSEFTQKAGWVDPKSELFARGIRPGDELWAFNGKPYQGIQDLIYLGLTNTGPVDVEGAKVFYATGEKAPFNLQVQPYPHPLKKDKSFWTPGVLAPANYLVYDVKANGKENPLPEGSPSNGSGIQYGDQIVWMDGNRIFSLHELSTLLNDGRALLTVQRNGNEVLARVPRVPVQEFKMDSAFREELADWQYASNLNSIKLPKLIVLPYNLTNQGVVENRLDFIDKEHEVNAFPEKPFSPLELPLQAGDKIIAVDGVPVQHSSDILKLIQIRQVNLIVQRPIAQISKVSWKDADQAFDTSVNTADLNKISSGIGTTKPVKSSGSLVLLSPIAVKTHAEIYKDKTEELKKQIAALDDPDRRSRELQQLNERESRFDLGLPLQDVKVQYNPLPTEQFFTTLNEIWRTLTALVTGSLNLKWMSGPIGIVSMFQEQSRVSLTDGLYFLGAISLNLGVLNLLPIPMLDGGTIVFCLFEMITGRKLKPKTLEKLILPFAILLIFFFLYLTFNDLSRIFSGFWRW